MAHASKIQIQPDAMTMSLSERFRLITQLKNTPTDAPLHARLESREPPRSQAYDRSDRSDYRNEHRSDYRSRDTHQEPVRQRYSPDYDNELSASRQRTKSHEPFRRRYLNSDDRDSQPRQRPRSEKHEARAPKKASIPSKAQGVAKKGPKRPIEARLGKTLDERLGKTLDERLGKTLDERLGKRIEERLGKKVAAVKKPNQAKKGGKGKGY
jgi:hypothetical protein